MTQRLAHAGEGVPDAISLREVWHLLGRHRALLTSVLTAVLGGTALVTFLLRPTYRSSTTLRVTDRSPTLPAAIAPLSGASPAGEVPTEMEVIESRSVAEHVVDSLGLRLAILPSLPLIGRAPPRRVFTRVRVTDAALAARYRLERGAGARFVVRDSLGTAVAAVRPGERAAFGGVELTLSPLAAGYSTVQLQLLGAEQTVDALQKVLTVTQPNQNARIIVVAYEDGDPELARDVLNVLTRGFIDQHRRAVNAGASGTAEFLRTQIAALSRQLASAEGDLLRYRERAKVINPTEQSGTAVTSAADLAAQRTQTGAERDALQALVADVSRAAAAAPPGAPSPYRQLLAYPSLLRNPAVAQLLSSLTELDNERANLINRRTPEDPDVQTLTKRIAGLEGETRALATTYLAGLAKQVDAMDLALTRSGATMAGIPEKELTAARLGRRVKLLEDTYTSLQMRLQEARIAEAADDPSIQVIDAARAPTLPARPNILLNLSLGAVLGCLAGVGACFARDALDRTVRTREELRAVTGFPVLATIPRLRDTRLVRSPSRVVAARLPWRPPLLRAAASAMDSRAQAMEAYRTLRTNIAFALADDSRTILVTSPVARDGKSTSALNTALMFAQLGCRVALVDADMRRGKLNVVLGTDVAPGLSDLLSGRASPSQARTRVEVESGGALEFIPAGTFLPYPSELLGSPRMHEIVEALRGAFDFVLLDAPPLNLVSDAAILSKEADAVVLVARAGQTTAEELEYAVEQLASVQARVIGCVLNDVEVAADEYYYSTDFPVPMTWRVPPPDARNSVAGPNQREEQHS